MYYRIKPKKILSLVLEAIGISTLISVFIIALYSVNHELTVGFVLAVVAYCGIGCSVVYYPLRVKMMYDRITDKKKTS